MRLSSPSPATSDRAARSVVATISIVTFVGCGAATVNDARRPRGDLHTTTYLSTTEAIQTVFPDAARVVHDDVDLSAAEVNEIREVVGERLRRRRFRTLLGITEDGRLDGYAVIHEEIGKFKYFTFIVGVEPDGSVRRVAVMVYRESRGGEVARRRFLGQYDGKTTGDPIRLNRDVLNIVGATMSVRSLNTGVRKVLALVESLYRRRPAHLEKVLRSAPQRQDLLDVVASSERSGQHREARLVMGSVCEIEVRHEDDATRRSACRRAFAEIERVDRLLSDYRPDSEISGISGLEADESIAVSPATAEFLLRSARISSASEGAFDVTVGPLVDAWGFRRRSARRPSADELAELRTLVDYRALGVRRDDDGAWTVTVARSGMRLDPGATGKGFAVDRAVVALREAGVESALINFSGCIYALGSPPGAAGWRVAIRDPSRPNRILGTALLRDEAMAASGSHERFVEIDGERLGHILSPRTLRPVSGVLGAVVRARDATLADGWSTAAAVLATEAIPLLEEHREISGLVALESGTRTTRDWRVEPLERK